jgi:OPA family sugar phosphate sensor protein UhpC-like MFS transporter
VAFLSLFKTADPVDEICDEAVVKQKYRHWRLRIFFGMYIGYAFYYFTRKSLNFILPSLMQDLSLTKVDVGIFGTIIYISYGLSKFLSGIISDRSNPRYFMSTGLIITGILNILFGFSSSMIIFSLIWFLNGMFQGWGWPPCARLLTHWYSQNERGSWWSLWSTSHNSGAALITLLCPFIAQYFGWRMGMYIPGVLSIIVGCWMMYTLRDTPQSLGLPPIEKFRKEDDKNGENERELTLKERLFHYVLNNRLIWLLSFSYFFVYIIRTVINDWGMFFLIEQKGFSNIAAGTALFWFEAGGFLGILLAGIASDRLFQGKRIPISVLFSLLVLSGLFALWVCPSQGYLIACFGMFLVGFFIFGPQMLIGIAAAEMSHKKAAGTATGFAGWFGYAGAACGAAPFGALSHHFGWVGVFIALFACSILSALFLLPLWSVKKGVSMKVTEEVQTESIDPKTA